MHSELTHEEIARALRTCNNPKGHRCSECPVFSKYDYNHCKAIVDTLTADIIESQDKQLAELTAENEQLQAEITVLRDFQQNLHEEYHKSPRYNMGGQQIVDTYYAANTEPPQMKEDNKNG